LVRREKVRNVRIGLENRFASAPKAHKGTPGPKYDPAKRPEIPNDPAFSFGVRREIAGYSPIAPFKSTPAMVGPGKYHVDNKIPCTSIHKDNPVVGFTKQIRFQVPSSSVQKNQTYEQYTAFNGQLRSKKTTEPRVGFTKAHRGTPMPPLFA
jgi:hypothetical protein